MRDLPLHHDPVARSRSSNGAASSGVPQQPHEREREPAVIRRVFMTGHMEVIMSDPYLNDPRSRDPYMMPDPMRDDRPVGSSTVGWVVGAVVLAALLAFVFGVGRDTTNKTAELNNPPASTAPTTRPAAPGPT